MTGVIYRIYLLIGYVISRRGDDITCRKSHRSPNICPRKRCNAMMGCYTQQEEEQEQDSHSVTQHNKEQTDRFHASISARGDAKARSTQQSKYTRPTVRETQLKTQSQSR